MERHANSGSEGADYAQDERVGDVAGAVERCERTDGSERVVKRGEV